MHSSYLGIDVGGSKTLLAVFDKDGKIIRTERFETPKDYPGFLSELKLGINKITADTKIDAVCCAMPGLIDRKKGVVREFGNLAWENIPIKADLESVLPNAKVYIENDANLAGLSEALLVLKKYSRVLYLTISTGIGDGIIINGIIDTAFADSEPGQMVLEHDGKLQKWEDFASGRAIKEQTGKLASQIDDDYYWHKYVKGLAKGIDVLVATLSPAVIIIGGGVGAHYEKFGHFLTHELRKYENNMIKMPPVIKAKRSEEAVIYGCFDFIQQQQG